jgi:ribonuclease E
MSHSSRRVESFGGEEYDDDGGNDRFRFSLRRKYKIQEVIKRGQIMLVQVSKEERGNKGAVIAY